MITADDREVEEIAGYIRRLNVPVRVERLPSADYAFQGIGPAGCVVNVGVERKTIPDLVGRLLTGTAIKQLTALTSEHDYPFLLVEGVYKPGAHGELLVFDSAARGWVPFRYNRSSKVYMYSFVEKFLLSVGIQTNIRVLKTASKVETASVLVNLHQWFSRRWEDHSTVNMTPEVGAPGALSLVKPKLRQLWAEYLPGIGGKRARAVAAYFKSARQMANAEEEEWEEIEGIGSLTAKKAVSAIREEG